MYQDEVFAVLRGALVGDAAQGRSGGSLLAAMYDRTREGLPGLLEVESHLADLAELQARLRSESGLPSTHLAAACAAQVAVEVPMGSLQAVALLALDLDGGSSQFLITRRPARGAIYAYSPDSPWGEQGGGAALEDQLGNSTSDVFEKWQQPLKEGDAVKWPYVVLFEPLAEERGFAYDSFAWAARDAGGLETAESTVTVHVRCRAGHTRVDGDESACAPCPAGTHGLAGMESSHSRFCSTAVLTLDPQ